MKILKYIGISILIAGSLFAAAFFVKTNNKSAITFETEKMFKTSIEKKTVVTGKVIPEDEVEITPQIQGIAIDRISQEFILPTVPTRQSSFSCPQVDLKTFKRYQK